MTSPIAELEGVAQDAGVLDTVPLAGEAPADTQSRAAQTGAARTKLKAADLSSRGVASFTSPTGQVSEVTDPTTGDPLNGFSRRTGIGYNSQGQPRKVSYADPTAPTVTDPYEDAPQRTDKAGNTYVAPKGLPWQQTGTDPATVEALATKKRAALDAQASTALAPEYTAARTDLLASQKAAKQSGKATASQLQALGVPTTDALGQPAVDLDNDPEAARNHIEQTFNKEYASPAANASPLFGGARYTADATTLRKDIDDRKAAALAALNSHVQTVAQVQQSRGVFDQLRQQRQQLQGNRLDAVNARRQAEGLAPVGIPGLEQAAPAAPSAQPTVQTQPEQPVDDWADAPTESAASSNQASQPTTPFSDTEQPYRLDETGQVSFDPKRLTAGITAAAQAGHIDAEKAAKLLPLAQAAEKAYQDQEKLLANDTVASKLKALGVGATKGAAFLAGAPAGAALGAEGGTAIAPGPGTAIGGALGGLITGSIAAYGASKIIKKLGEYSSTIQSFQDAADAHPYYDAAGNLVAFGAGIPKAGFKAVGSLIGGAERTVSAGTRIAEQTAAMKAAGTFPERSFAEGLKARVAAAPEVLNPANLRQAVAQGYENAGGGVASTIGNLTEEARRRALGGASPSEVAKIVAARVGGNAAGMVLIDTAIKEGSKALGLSDEGQTLPGAAQAALLGAFFAGHGIKFADTSSAEMADILSRAKVRLDSGVALNERMEPSQMKPGTDIHTAEALSKPLTPREMILASQFEDEVQRLVNTGKIKAPQTAEDKLSLAQNSTGKEVLQGGTRVAGGVEINPTGEATPSSDAQTAGTAPAPQLPSSEVQPQGIPGIEPAQQPAEPAPTVPVTQQLSSPQSFGEKATIPSSSVLAKPHPAQRQDEPPAGEAISTPESEQKKVSEITSVLNKVRSKDAIVYVFAGNEKFELPRYFGWYQYGSIYLPDTSEIPMRIVKKIEDASGNTLWEPRPTTSGETAANSASNLLTPETGSGPVERMPHAQAVQFYGSEARANQLMPESGFVRQGDEWVKQPATEPTATPSQEINPASDSQSNDVAPDIELAAREKELAAMDERDPFRPLVANRIEQLKAIMAQEQEIAAAQQERATSQPTAPTANGSTGQPAPGSPSTSTQSSIPGIEGLQPSTSEAPSATPSSPSAIPGASELLAATSGNASVPEQPARKSTRKTAAAAASQGSGAATASTGASVAPRGEVSSEIPGAIEVGQAPEPSQASVQAPAAAETPQPRQVAQSSSTESAPVAAKGQGLHIVGPALRENGQIIAQGKIGQTHAELIRDAAANDIDATDAERGFVDSNGDFLTREQAARIAEAAGQRREGTSGPIQSEHLQETPNEPTQAPEEKPSATQDAGGQPASGLEGESKQQNGEVDAGRSSEAEARKSDAKLGKKYATGAIRFHNAALTRLEPAGVEVKFEPDPNDTSGIRIDIGTLAIRLDDEKIGRYAKQVEEAGHNGQTWVRAAVGEELDHAADILASAALAYAGESPSAAFERIHNELYEALPKGTAQVMERVYSGSKERMNIAAEYMRMLAQRRRGELLTEATYGEKTRAITDLLDGPQPPMIERHYEAMESVVAAPSDNLLHEGEEMTPQHFRAKVSEAIEQVNRDRNAGRDIAASAAKLKAMEERWSKFKDANPSAFAAWKRDFDAVASLKPGDSVLLPNDKTGTVEKMNRTSIKVMGQKEPVPMTALRPARVPGVTEIEASKPTPAQDAEYLAAVQRGDMKEAQRMVDKAARGAGYSRDGWHGGPNGISIFQTPSFFADDEAHAKAFAYGKKDQLIYKVALKPSSRDVNLTQFENKDVTAKEYLDAVKFQLRKDVPTMAKTLSGHGDKLPAWKWTRFIQKKNPQAFKQDGIASLRQVEKLDESPSHRRVTLVTDPGQIKSLEPVTRDSSGNAIPLSERFNPASDSILYAGKPNPLVVSIKAKLTNGTLSERIQALSEKSGWTSIVDDIQKVLAPDERLTPKERTEFIKTGDINAIGDARKTGNILRGITAAMDRRKKQFEAQLKELRTLVDKLPLEQKHELQRRIDEGTPLKSGPIGDAVKQLVKLDAAKAQELKDFLDAHGMEHWANFQNFEKYIVPHAFTDQAEAAKVIDAMLRDKKMTAGTGFLKHREGFTIREIQDFAKSQGIDLVPKHDNIVDAVMDRWTQQERYMGAHQMIDRMAQNGTGHWEGVDYQPKAGEKMVNNIIGNRTVEVKGDDGTMSRRKQYFYADEPSAQIVNNYLSRGLRSGHKWIENYFEAANILNSAQLGLSFFHGGFVTMEGMVSSFANGLRRVLAGDMSGLKDIAMSPVSTWHDWKLGGNIREEMLNPGKFGQQHAAVVNAMVDAGFRDGVDSFYNDNHISKLMSAFREKRYLPVLLRAPWALIELMAKPIMEHYVPRMKAAAIYKMAQTTIKQSPGISAAELHNRLSKDVESGNNRFGQMTYDNLHLHKIVKDILMGMTRSLGWNWGTFSELGGGIAQWLNYAKNAAKATGNRLAGAKGAAREFPQITNKMAYTLALPLLVGLMGAALSAMFGKTPKELKDYYFIQTGETDERGNTVRVVLPSYMKDVFHAAHDPVSTVTNKLHPLLSTIGAMLENKDFYGVEIRHAGDPVMKQILQELAYAAKQFVPFTGRNAAKYAASKAPPIIQVGGFLGLTQAPARLGKSDAQNLADEINASSMPTKVRTSEEAEKTQVRSQIIGLMRQGKGSAELADAQRKGILTAHDIPYIQRMAKLTPLQASVSRLSLPDAERVLDKATPDEKREIQPMVLAKRGRAEKGIPGLATMR